VSYNHGSFKGIPIAVLIIDLQRERGFEHLLEVNVEISQFVLEDIGQFFGVRYNTLYEIFIIG
jgi:hypothetical protein